ncbi:MAG: insulinase family protein, partial [Acidimicrobiia bacterium]|nr:insulinase family protein [Acidimicrobiia bacterium]
MFLSLGLVAAACTGDGNNGAGDGNATSGGDPASQSDGDGAGDPIENLPDPDPTPIEVSADVTIGRLDNGLDYYVMNNDSPGGQAELLLVVDAGSAQQKVPDSGAAHFLEHMMFNGTEEFP